MRRMVLTGVLSLLIVTVAYAAYNISHPDLKNAAGAAEQAIQHIQDAQKYNKEKGGVGFGGHAENAIDLLKKAQNELIEADKYNDAHQKKPKQ